jgi:uncharacterized RDD family membrane protein YckC
MNCEKCGEVCGCPMEPPPTESLADLAPLIESAEESDSVQDSGKMEADGTAWRGELAARLNRYRARRKAPPPRYPSLKLPFESANFSPPASVSAQSSSFAGFEPVSNHALALDGACEESSSPPQEQLHLPEPAVLSPPSAKIIEFPRFAWAPPPPPPDQLAEPVIDKPRILDVPEAELPAPALGGITIEPLQSEEPEKRLGIDIPLQSAPLGRRLFASVVDGTIIAAASALFGYIFWNVTGLRPPELQLLSLGAGIPCVFWATYQYLLIVYAASTPGMRAAGLDLARFDGSATTRATRRWRILASYLSAASLGMGYAWVFLDEDALCWHDRITHTYLAPRKRAEDGGNR